MKTRTEKQDKSQPFDLPFHVCCLCSSAGERPDDRPGVSGDVAHYRYGAAGEGPPGTGRTGQAGKQ